MGGVEHEYISVGCDPGYQTCLSKLHPLPYPNNQIHAAPAAHLFVLPFDALKTSSVGHIAQLPDAVDLGANFGWGGKGGGSLTNSLAGASVSTSVIVATPSSSLAPLSNSSDMKINASTSGSDTNLSGIVISPTSGLFLDTILLPSIPMAAAVRSWGAQEMPEQQRCIHSFNFPPNFPPTLQHKSDLGTSSSSSY